MKRWWAITGIAALLLQLIVLLGSSGVQAIQDPGGGATNPNVAIWVDRAHISFRGHIYFDGNIGDGHFTYYRIDDPDQCTDFIANFSTDRRSADVANDPDLIYHELIYSVQAGGCSGKEEHNTAITIVGTSNNLISFLWVDSGTIIRADDGKEYTLNKDVGTFLENESNCRDSITATNGKDSGTLSVWAKSGDDIKNDYNWYPFDQTLEDQVKNGQTTSKDGCVVSKPVNIQIGNTENATKPPGSGATSQHDDAAASGCSISGGFAFILCPTIDMGNQIFRGLESEVVNILQTGPLDNQSYQGAYNVWQAFRGLANILFILIFLVVIFSSTLSIGLSNYDIKKILPRLVIAVVLVQFSWILMQLAFDITNIISAGIADLITRAVPSTVNTSPSDVINAVGIAITGIAAVAITVAFALPLIIALFSLILSILAVFLTLELRKLILLILIVLAPFAFIAWVLPNTESIFKTWFKTFSRLLLMYPLIVLLFAFAGIGSAIVNYSPSADIWQIILASLFPIAAFFAVPMTFKWAGSGLTAANNAFGKLTAGAGNKLAGDRLSDLEKQRQSNRARNRAAKREITAGKLYSGGFFGRKAARALTGNKGKIGNARLLEATRKAQEEQTKAERDKLSVALERDIGNDTGQEATLLKAAKSSNEYTRQAAYEAMIDRNMFGTKGLAGLAGAKMDKDVAWQRTKNNKWSDISDKGGFMLESGGLEEKIDSFTKKASLAQIAKTKAGAAQAIYESGSVAAQREFATKAASIPSLQPRLMADVITDQGTWWTKIGDKVGVPMPEQVPFDPEKRRET
ncbi:MAG TPA: hypothetical protein VLE72_02745 [Candidatus Saccharimonadales bacterium]|nr:hypothetical protein [Candidatus Saccharimonadales bacterium]